MDATFWVNGDNSQELFQCFFVVLLCLISIFTISLMKVDQQLSTNYNYFRISISTISLISEGLLFFLLGAFIYSIQFGSFEDDTNDFTFSWSMLLITLLALVVSRVVSIYLMSLIGYLIVGGKKWRLNSYEYQILTISGMVKGAVPFALILSMPSNSRLDFTTASIQNTVIIVIFLTTFFVNSLMPKFLRNRLKKIDLMVKQNSTHPSVFDSLLIQYKR